MEVLVALAVFLLSMVGLGTLVRMSGERAADVRQQSWAIQRCQSKLAEVIAGAVPLNSQSEVPFDEDPAWVWSLDVQDAGITGLMTVTVRVSRERPDRGRLETSLTQMVLDPALKGGSAPAATLDAGSSAGTSGTTGTGGTTTPSSGGSSGGRQ
jgi:hypothetical protein